MTRVVAHMVAFSMWTNSACTTQRGRHEAYSECAATETESRVLGEAVCYQATPLIFESKANLILFLYKEGTDTQSDQNLLSLVN